jgi:hypothetical protein
MPIPDKMAKIFQSLTAGPKAVGSGTSQFFTGMPLVGGEQAFFSKSKLFGKIPFVAPNVKNVGMGYGGYLFGKHAVYDPIQEGNRDRVGEAMQQAQLDFANKQNATRVRVEYEDLQRRMTQATMRLAALDPHLYNEVMAGRSLPKDAVVFGGQPRTDLMEELAMSMADGQFKEPQSAHDELMQELGV